MRDAFTTQPALAAHLIEPSPGVVVAPLAAPGLTGESAHGLDLILEGFLLHHGRPRHLQLPESRRILAGDYCYAHGLVYVAQTGNLSVVAQLADLVALSSALVATGERDTLAPLWRATVAVIARGGEAQDLHLSAAKDALRGSGDTGPIRALAATLPHTPQLDEALTDA